MLQSFADAAEPGGFVARQLLDLAEQRDEIEYTFVRLVRAANQTKGAAIRGRRVGPAPMARARLGVARIEHDVQRGRALRPEPIGMGQADRSLRRPTGSPAG